MLSKQKKILVVDDEVDILAFLQEILEWPISDQRLAVTDTHGLRSGSWLKWFPTDQEATLLHLARECSMSLHQRHALLLGHQSRSRFTSVD